MRRRLPPERSATYDTAAHMARIQARSAADAAARSERDRRRRALLVTEAAAAADDDERRGQEALLAKLARRSQVCTC